MTAEIAIMNKEAIALAADSAVTSISGESNQKIFPSANKLFTLSKYHPVGIMIYGSAVFMGVPWESIIKVYRRSLGRKSFDTLTEYADDFLAHFEKAKDLFPESLQDEYAKNAVGGYFEFIKTRILRKIDRLITEKGEVSAKSVPEIVATVIAANVKTWRAEKEIPNIPSDFVEAIKRRFADDIDKMINGVFEKLPIEEESRNQLREIATHVLSKFPESVESHDFSGVVVAGFGDKEVFPSLRSFLVDAITNNNLRYRSEISTQIGTENSASIVPFAQREMVTTFMEGVDPALEAFARTYLSKMFSEYPRLLVESMKLRGKRKAEVQKRLLNVSIDTLKKYIEETDKMKASRYVRPVTSVVAILPKDELAAMAESLVNLTSFKRRVTMERETVGGPIDVAVISKGDGFVWIKRKHYFKAELNPQFFANYFREYTDA